MQIETLCPNDEDTWYSLEEVMEQPLLIRLLAPGTLHYKMRKKVQHLLKVNALLRGCFYGSLLISAVFMGLCIYLAVDNTKESNEVIELLANDSNPVIELQALEVNADEF